MLDRRDTETGSASSFGVDGPQELVDFLGEERDLSFTVDRNVRLDACVPARLYAPASRLLEPSTHRASRAAFIDVFNELKLKEPYTCASHALHAPALMQPCFMHTACTVVARVQVHPTTLFFWA